MKALEILYLSYEDVRNLNISMKEIVGWVEEVFNLKGQGRCEMPPKIGLHTMPDALMHAMPAYIPALRSVGIKWASGYPENYRRGLPYVSGLLILNDPETGIPTAVMDATWITAMRTGAATAVAAKYLARADSHTVGILGCGLQGRTNLEALSVLFAGIATVKAYDILPQAQEKYVREMKERFGYEVVGVDSPREAVVGSDIVVTAGPILKEPRPVIDDGWLKEGAFAAPVDFDSCWKKEALLSVDKFCVDDIPQIMYFKSQGYFKTIPRIYADLGEVVANKKPGRESDRERIMSMNLGLALEDMAVAIRIYRLALEEKVGHILPP
jgi:ornithine cyclodeaminase/alanine dehydrogenase-like protein (mu-crystallin family)